VRAHGTHACYVFGPEPGGDTRRGCRCADCKAAAASYERDRKRREVPPYVSASAAREHVAWLSTQGVGLKQIVKAAGVSQGALWKLVYGKRRPDGTQVPSKRIRPETAERILAVTPADGAAGSRVPAGPVWDDVGRLLARGWTKRAIARAIGDEGANGLQLGRDVITRRNANAIRALLDQPVPSDVGAAWSAHHQAEHADEAVEPPPLDDRDRVTIALVELLEARIDQRPWRARSACRGKPAWLFFPQRGDHETVQAAKAVCRTCPVSTECLAANLGERDGVYGGLSGKERRNQRQGTAA
jgi:WhiB family redox-sensing transcriptional regulator